MTMLVGDPERLDEFLATAAGAHVAFEMAARIWNDADALAQFEMGLERHPGAVEAILDAQIARRNRADS